MEANILLDGQKVPARQLNNPPNRPYSNLSDSMKKNPKHVHL